jgi:hypothetical protein
MVKDKEEQTLPGGDGRFSALGFAVAAPNVAFPGSLI